MLISFRENRTALLEADMVVYTCSHSSGGGGDKGEGLANLGHTVRLFQNKRGKPNALGGIPVTSMFRRGRCWHPARVAGCYS